jgi:hypothetical protein
MKCTMQDHTNACQPATAVGIFAGCNGGFYYNYGAWLLKVDSDGNQEWFKNVNYQTCNDCENVL